MQQTVRALSLIFVAKPKAKESASMLDFDRTSAPDQTHGLCEYITWFELSLQLW